MLVGQVDTSEQLLLGVVALVICRELLVQTAYSTDVVCLRSPASSPVFVFAGKQLPTGGLLLRLAYVPSLTS